MRNLALAIAATLVLAVVSPAFAQPFADVPTDHWAFDAIAELAAKGIIEGFPDGTFKGDRGVTRYEVAMIVARILARIEAIKIPTAAPAPAAPAPQVTRADVQTIQRLVNEFRAELAALGVRVTAVEEELTALKGAADKTRLSGEANYRLVLPASTGGSGGSGSWGQALLTFTSATGSDASATFRLNLGTGGGVFGWGAVPGNNEGCVPPQPPPSTDAGGGCQTIEAASFDRAYLDFKYFGFDWRVGRQSPVLGPVGLLYTECNVVPGTCGGHDGAVVTGSFGPVALEVASFLLDQDSAGTGAGYTTLNTTVSYARGAFDLAGWSLGASWYTERNIGGSLADGYAVDLSGNLFGFGLTGEWASYDGATTPAATSYQATLNLSSLVSGMMGGGTSLSVWYKNFASAAAGWTPLYPGSSEMLGSSIVDDLNVWGARLSFTLSPQLRPYIGYETGTRSTGNITEYEVGIRSRISANVDARVRYQHREQGTPTVLDRDRYRVELFYSW